MFRPAGHVTNTHPSMVMDCPAGMLVGLLIVIGVVSSAQLTRAGRPVIATDKSAMPVLLITNVTVTGALVWSAGNTTWHELFAPGQLVRLNEEDNVVWQTTL